MDDNQPELINIDGWTFRVRKPIDDHDKNRVILLLHGHLGNENAMWILTNPISEQYTMLAPRAPQKMGPEQYSWHGIGPQWPGIEIYKDLIYQLYAKVDQWLGKNHLETPKYDVMGFSQGAVLAFAMAMITPERVRRIAALAGFIPESWRNYLTNKDLSHIEFFIAHGTEDDIIPIKKAKKSSQWLKDTGAKVTFCAAKTGHKISSNCFNGLGEFFE
jgi:phospholipase/carboxylesterase